MRNLIINCTQFLQVTGPEVKSVFSPAIFSTTEVNFAEHLFYSNVVFEFLKISYIFANEETQV